MTSELSSVTLQHSFTSCFPQLEWASEDLFAQRAGNGIILLDSRNQEQLLLSIPRGYSIDAFSCCPSLSFIACAMHGLEAVVTLYSVPQFNVLGHLPSLGSLQFQTVAVSVDGQRCLTVGCSPMSKLICWDITLCSDPKILFTKDLVEDISFLSWKPKGHESFCYGTNKSVTICNFENRFGELKLLTNVAKIDENTDKSDFDFICHCWDVDGSVVLSNQFGDLLRSKFGNIEFQTELSHSSVDLEVSTFCMARSLEHFVLGCENGTLLFLNKDTFDTVETKEYEGRGIYSIAYSPSYTKLVFGDLNGSILGLEKIIQSPFSVNLFTGSIIISGIVVFPNSSRMGIYSTDGSLIIWDSRRNVIIGSYYAQSPITSAVCCPDEQLLVMGYDFGAVCLVDVRVSDKISMLYQKRFHSERIIMTLFNKNGTILATLGTDSTVCFIRTSDFTLIGCIKSPDEITCIEWMCLSKYSHSDAPLVERLIITTSTGQIASYTPPSVNNEIKDSSEIYLSDEITKPLYGDLLIGSSRIKSIDGSSKFFSIGLDKKLHLYDFNINKGLISIGSWDGHDMKGNCVSVSPDGRWVASGGSDGQVILRPMNNLSTPVILSPHDFTHQGVSHIYFSSDSQLLITCGYDGAVFSWNLNFDVFSSQSPRKPRIADSILDSKQINELIRTDCEELDDSSPLYVDIFLQTENRNKAKQSQPERARIQNELRALKEKFMQIVSANSRTQDIEQLERSELVLDLAEQNRIMKEGDKIAQKVEEDIQKGNLGKELVFNRIKTAFWDSLEVVDQYVIAFKSGIKVCNFPLRKFSIEEQQRNQRLLFLRQIEKDELRWRRTDRLRANQAAFFKERTLSTNVNYIVCLHENKQDKIKTQPSQDKTDSKAKSAKIEMDEDEAEANDPHHLYHPLECHSPSRRRIQIRLLQLKINDLKSEFNKDFLKIFESKQRDIERIIDHNQRIAEIHNELKLHENIWTPKLQRQELPHTELEIQDDQISAKKILSKVERAQLELEEKQKAKRLSEREQDDKPGRALKEMMGGKLETKKDLITLDEELRRDIWMDEIPFEKMSDEQKQLLAEFDRRQKLIATEKENRKKLLETDLKKFKSSISDICKSFDDQLQNLSNIRLSVYEEILTLELLISYHCLALLQDEQQEVKSDEYHRQRSELEKQQIEIENEINSFRSLYETSEKECQHLEQKDKYLLTSFRSEFRDAERYIKSEDLKKLLMYRKGKGGKHEKKRGEKSRKPISKFENVEKKIINQNLNPFFEENKDDISNDIEALDIERRPPELPIEYWIRLEERRAEKIKSEISLQKAQKKLNEYREHATKLDSQSDNISRRILQLDLEWQEYLTWRKSNKLGTTIMLRLKQGAVEIPTENVIMDLNDAVFIDRSVVEEKNKVIRDLGQRKIDALLGIKDLARNISFLKWKRKIRRLTLKDCEFRTKQFHLMHVTKEHQTLMKQFAKEEETGSKVATSIEQNDFEEKLSQLDNITQQKAEKVKKNLNRLDQKINDISVENERLTSYIKELEESLADRERIFSVRSETTPSNKMNPTMKNVVAQRQLEDISKAQRAEIAYLKAELDRLHKRTFPSFVQVSLTLDDTS